MNDVRNDIDGGKLSGRIDEAEETRIVPGARSVKALDFHSNIAGSKPVGDTWCKNMSNDFKITRKEFVVDGITTSRLSVLT